MKRGVVALLSLTAVLLVAYFTADKWAIRHETISLHDTSRDNRLVPVEITVRRDVQMRADAGLLKLPVAFLSRDNSGKPSEYSRIADSLAERGYLVISPQHDLPSDPPIVTKVGELYVGRLRQVQRGVANIEFIVGEMKKTQPQADFERLTLVGNGIGAGISMYFAKEHPEQVRKVVTLDDLRVPFLSDGKLKTLSFRSKSNQLDPDPGVVPSDEEAEKAGIAVVGTEFQHNDMRDTGPDNAKKNSIQAMLDKFLNDGAKQAGDAGCHEKVARVGVFKELCVDLSLILDRLEAGRYFFNKPERAYVGDSFELRLILTTSDKQHAQPAFLGIVGPVIEKEGKFGQSMEATLRGQDLKAEPAGPQSRTVTTANHAEWSWIVTPQAAGTKSLTVDVSVIIEVGATEQKKISLPALHEVIVIEVSAFQRMKQYLAEANGFVVTAAAAVPSLAVLLGLWPKFRTALFDAWRRRKRNRLRGRAKRTTG